MDHAITRAPAGATPSTTPPAAAAPRSWMLCLTSANHGTVGPLGSTFPHAGEKHERVQVMEIVEAGAPPAPGVDLAGLVRFDLVDLDGDDERFVEVGAGGYFLAHQVEARVAAAAPALPVGEFQGYVDGEPFVAWADRTRMPQVGDKLYVGAAPSAAQAGQVAVPEGFVLMPRRLTAENGAKSLLIGEFNESTRVTCHECDGSGEDSEYDSGCVECGGEGTIEQTVAVEWDTIKRIYDMAVEHLAAAPSAPAVAQQAPADWISVDDRLPEGRYCLATYRDPAGKLRIIRAMYVRQFEIEASGDECDSETNEANDMEYLKAGWYEMIDNWGDYSSVHVSEGPVTHWTPLPPLPGAQASTAGERQKGGV